MTALHGSTLAACGPGPAGGGALARGAASGVPPRLRREIDEYLRELWDAPDAPSALLGGMRDAVLSGGKRIRPALSLATAEILGHASCEVLPIAASIELIHAFSLVHDDLPAMDDASLRRGRLTCHRVHGEGVAVLIGDALFAEALALVAAHQRGPAERVLAALRVILSATSVEGMAGGQFLDITHAAHADPGAFRLMNEWKTGSLFRAATLSVAAWADAPPDCADALDRYARALGQLFQLRDDVLDARGTTRRTGKAVGMDARNGSRTHLTDATSADLRATVRALQGEIQEALAYFTPFPTALAEMAGFAASRDH